MTALRANLELVPRLFEQILDGSMVNTMRDYYPSNFNIQHLYQYPSNNIPIQTINQFYALVQQREISGKQSSFRVRVL